MSTQSKQQIQQALQPFAQGDLRAHSLRLLETLGYQSERQLELDPAPAAFLAALDQGGAFRRDKALFDHWTAVHLLCQISDDDIRQSNQLILLDSAGKTIDNAIIESYLFIAIDLREAIYTRTQLAQITREVNRLFPMPVMLLFRHGGSLTLAIINRRLHRREQSKDVLEKVTLIKDIRLANPHRAHVEILFDLSLAELHRVHGFRSFVELHQAWQKTLDSSELNKKFFKEIANWYFWAVNQVVFPPDAGPDETRNATSVIRLITRLIFVWFLKEKGLVPDELFDTRALKALLTWDDPQESTFYKAILQNLFFATLNQEMNMPQQPHNRKFRGARASGQSQHYMIHNVYRYERYFRDPQAAVALFANIPFLNGGLFECLDKQVDGKVVRVDGFSDRPDNPLRVPDELFFGDERQIDLNETYGTAGKRYQVRGLIHTLNRYKFTITENTPIEEEIALDPELLGKVFENLLAAYNPETGTTARKQTGSFYTPREIVNYMVDESLLAYLQTKLQNAGSADGLSRAPAEAGTTNLEERLRHLLAYNEEPHQFSAAEVSALIAAIDHVNILDPACGSGAFPMGILHKLVFILGKLDPQNEQWKERQIAPLRAAIQAALAIPDSRIRSQTITELEEQIAAIEAAFARNELDYGRKLYLIENCIYGVDIQPVAVQIAKLRFFISLVVDQRIDDAAPNRGILPLPNLETKFVAANTLLGLAKPAQMALRNPAITAKERELAEVRSKHFRARTPHTKEKWRAEDKRLRGEIGDLLQQEGMLRNEDVARLAAWDPYDQNASADFFDPEWMFGLTAGFDVVIGNPPYVSHDAIVEKAVFKKLYKAYEPFADLYCYFIEAGLKAQDENGVLCFITSNSYLKAEYGKPLRKVINDRSQILSIINIEDYQVFESAVVNSVILLAQQTNNSHSQDCFVVNAIYTGQDSFDEFVSRNGFYYPQSEFSGEAWLLVDRHMLLLKKKIEMAGKTLESMQTKIRLGLATGANYAFIIDENQRSSLISQDPRNLELIKPILRGRDIYRYGYKQPESYILLTKNGINVERDYPVIYNYLASFGDAFKKRGAKGQHWTNLRGCAFFDDFKLEKIVWIELTDTGRFALCSEEIYLVNSAYFLIPPESYEAKYLLAILNSKVIQFYMDLTAETSGMGTNRWINNYVKNFPIPLGSQQAQSFLKRKVDQILLLSQAEDYLEDSNKQNKVEEYEQEIDQLVYTLYGLTPAEIALIEGREVDAPQVPGTFKVPGTSTTAASAPAAAQLLFTGRPPQGSFSEKIRRIEQLSQQASPAALQDLAAALADDNATIRWQAAAALKTIGGAAAAAALQGFLAHTDNPAAKAEAEQVLRSLT